MCFNPCSCCCVNSKILSNGSKMMHLVTFIFVYVVAFLTAIFGNKKITILNYDLVLCPNTNNPEVCYGTQVFFRFMLALAVFYMLSLLMSLLTSQFNNVLWGVKLFILALCMLGFLFISPKAISVMVYISIFVSLVYFAIQTMMLTKIFVIAGASFKTDTGLKRKSYILSFVVLVSTYFAALITGLYFYIKNFENCKVNFWLIVLNVIFTVVSMIVLEKKAADENAEILSFSLTWLVYVAYNTFYLMTGIEMNNPGCINFENTSAPLYVSIPTAIFSLGSAVVMSYSAQYDSGDDEKDSKEGGKKTKDGETEKLIENDSNKTGGYSHRIIDLMYFSAMAFFSLHMGIIPSYFGINLQPMNKYLVDTCNYFALIFMFAAYICSIVTFEFVNDD